MGARLLFLLSLLSLSQLSQTQQSKIAKRNVPDTCAVTTPAEHRFVPPWPYKADRSKNWFGTDGLWTVLSSDGTWGRGEKTFWFRQEWGLYSRDQRISDEDARKLTIMAHKLDGPAPNAKITQATSSYREEDLKTFLVGGIDFPAAGCWEVSSRYEADELRFVVWVNP